MPADVGWRGGQQPVRRALCAVALATCAALLQGCSTVKLAYNQLSNLAYWQLDSHLDLTDAQTERVRAGLVDLHQWHRGTMLPRHAELLRNVQGQLPSDVTAVQACATYREVRVQFDSITAQAEPHLAWLAAQVTDAQIRNLQRKQARSNADWRKDWLDVTPEKLREHRFKQLLSRAESFYGPLGAAQESALRAYLDTSSFDPHRTYADRLRRQKDLVQVLQKIAAERGNVDRARTLLRGYISRFDTPPEADLLAYKQTLVEEGCAGFARVHNAMTPAQRLKAVQSVNGYAQDFLVLAAQ